MGAHNVFAVRHGVQATQVRGFGLSTLDLESFSAYIDGKR